MLRIGIVYPLVSYRPLANYFFSVRVQLLVAYSYTCRAAFIRVAATCGQTSAAQPA